LSENNPNPTDASPTDVKPAAAPVIYGLQGLEFTQEEGAFFHAARPWGVILFARNIESRQQVRALTDNLREMSGNPHLPIFIDQEGGRVARLKPPLVPAYPPMGAYGEIYQTDKARAVEAARLGAALLAQDLHELGIPITCAPCLDLAFPDMSDVIGDRAFGDDVERVVVLGQAVLEGLQMGGVLPVLKHIPGHGRSRVDSHHDLPMIDTDIATLKATDFEVFRRTCAPQMAPLMAMTGHLRFNAIDASETSTFSKPLIEEVIRNYIGFDGLLMSDDISMGALSGDISSRVHKTLKAGCDVVLHCNGDAQEMNQIQDALKEAPNRLPPQAQARLSAVEQAIGELSCDVPLGARKVWGELVADIFPEAQNAL
jgi:beta-N-acetylhexosaminidase